VIEHVAPGAILDLDDPQIRVETNLAFEIGLGLGLRHRLLLETGVKRSIDRARFIERRLRGRAVKLRRPVEPIDLDEDGARLLGAAPAHHRERAFDMAAAQVGGNPDARFEAHRSRAVVFVSRECVA